MTQHSAHGHVLSKSLDEAATKLADRPLLPEFRPELAEPVVYRDANSVEHAALITRVIDDHTVHLVVFPDQGHHHHVTATAVDPEAEVEGWFPVDA